MAFIVLIPFTKFRHILTTSANYIFADRGPKGKLVSLDLENEDSETFGATSLKDMTWKDIFDADACTLCKRCQDRCPAYATGKPLSPMKIVNQIGEAAFNNPEANLIELHRQGCHSGPARPAGPARRSARRPSSMSARSSNCGGAWC